MLRKVVCAATVFMLFVFSACVQAEEERASVEESLEEILQEEDKTLPDGRALLDEETVLGIHAETEAFLTEAYGKGITAQLTGLEPVALYLACEDGAVTEVYDAYKASFTSPSGVMTERYTVVYYRNTIITADGMMTSDEPIHIGQRVEVSAAAQDGGYVIGYKSLNEMQKDVLGSMKTAISHQITEVEKWAE